MRRILVYVEGYTEEAFINKVIKPHLFGHDILIIPKIATTKEVIKGPNFKGGYVPYAKAKREIRRFLGDSDVVAVTTMLDYYGLPEDYPGMDALPLGDCFGRAEFLEDSLKDDINNRKFIPYFSLHEFEALVFTSPEEVDNAFPDISIKNSIEGIKSNVSSPEEINDGENTHPSIRLVNLLPSYRKALHGPIITERVGLSAIREECPHFASWITRLEELGQ